MSSSNLSIKVTIEMTLMEIFLSNLWLTIEMGLLFWFWYSTKRLYYLILISVNFLKFTRQIIQFAYLYFGDLKTCTNEDKQHIKLKYYNMDYQEEENLKIALFDTFYCINVINFIGYIGSFIYGLIYQSMEGAVGMIILTMMESFAEIFYFIFKHEDRTIRQTKIYKFKNRIQKGGSDICVICLEEFQVDEEIGLQLNELQCVGKHLFHQNCINSWFLFNKSCPLCKYKF